jgi:hypothetical protein
LLLSIDISPVSHRNDHFMYDELECES